MYELVTLLIIFYLIKYFNLKYDSYFNIINNIFNFEWFKNCPAALYGSALVNSVLCSLAIDISYLDAFTLSM
jgi:hypothetical protein